jgi:hypothetical protein
MLKIDVAALPIRQGSGYPLEVGSGNPHDLTTCSDIDMMSSNADGRFVHKDGTTF